MVKIVNILLTLGVFVAGYFLYGTLKEPITFKTESEKRDKMVQDKLTYIKDLQLAYKAEKDEFAASFDSLALFVESGTMKFTKIIGDRDQLDAEGNSVPVTYEVTEIAVKDSMTNPSYSLDQLAKVPGVDGENFTIDATTIERGRIIVPVFEVVASKTQIYKGLKEKYIAKDETWQVGSLLEPNYNGNW